MIARGEKAAAGLAQASSTVIIPRMAAVIATAATNSLMVRAGTHPPAGRTTAAASTIRGGEAMMANEPATFWAARAIIGLAPRPVAAVVEAVENIAVAPVLDPVR